MPRVDGVARTRNAGARHRRISARNVGAFVGHGVGGELGQRVYDWKPRASQWYAALAKAIATPLLVCIFLTPRSPHHHLCARSRWKRTSARSASAAVAGRTRPSRGIRGSPSSPPPTSRASSAMQQTRRRRCCTGHDLASTRGNLAFVMPRNKSIARINETTLSVPLYMPSVADALDLFFLVCGAHSQSVLDPSQQPLSGSHRPRNNNEFIPRAALPDEQIRPIAPTEGS